MEFELPDNCQHGEIQNVPGMLLAINEVLAIKGINIERQVLGVGRHSSRLLASGQHLKRGVLLHGAPGTGKTHTVRYLISQLPGMTVIVISGRALGRIMVARPLPPAGDHRGSAATGGYPTFAAMDLSNRVAPRAAVQPAWTEGVKPTQSRH